MNNDRRFREGERVRLQVDADVDGFLFVLNYDTDGRLRVLFPLDPRDDALVRAGRRYEVRDDGSESAFRAGADGSGVIYSAISREPWRFDDFVLGDRWDYSRLTVDRNTDDPEAAITELLQQIGGPGGFDYDVAGYRVYGSATYSYGGYHSRGPIYVYDDYLYCNSWYGCYDGYRSPYAGGWSFGFGYNPYGYGYRPYGYGYNPYGYGSRPYGYGYNPSYPYTPYRPSVPVGRAPVIAGRSRSYTVFPRPATGGTRVGGSFGSRGTPAGAVSAQPVNWRPRSVARPANDRGPQVTRGSNGRSDEARGVVNPPARRARGDAPGYSAPEARGGGDRRGAEPRAANPPQRAQPSNGGGGGGGGSGGRVSGGGSSGGGRSAPPPAPSRPRRP